MWYAFRPADDKPEDKPLAVFFNGGPGNSSALLFALNTNAVTLDPDVAGDLHVVDNAYSWTRFANVLYVDPREAGFSYDVPRQDGAESHSVAFIPEHDASYYVRFLLAFLGRHPQISGASVILIGESYGGHRASLILQQLLFPDELLEGNRFRDPALRDEIIAHFLDRSPELEPEQITPSVIAGQFGHQVLIQPAITWINGHSSFTPVEEQALKCISEYDWAQCDSPAGWSEVRSAAVYSALVSPGLLSLALGVDASSIEWMHSDARADSYSRGVPDLGGDEEDFRAVFGELPEGEGYYYPVYAREQPSPSSKYSWVQEYYGTVYIRVLKHVNTLITNAGKDRVVYSPDIPRSFESYPGLISSVSHDTSVVDDELRPGKILVKFGGSDESREIRFPFYSGGGHVVSQREPGALAEDVEVWFIGR